VTALGEVTMNRRGLIALLGGSALAWPLIARAQQKRAPVVAVLGGWAIGPGRSQSAALRQALAENGYVDGQNVTIEYRGQTAITTGFRPWPPISSPQG